MTRTKLAVAAAPVLSGNALAQLLSSGVLMMARWR